MRGMMGKESALLAGHRVKGGSCFPESRLVALVEVKMNSIELAAKGLSAAWEAEIERAIDNVKRSAWDKWFRREWYRATATIGRARRGQPRREWQPRRRYWKSRQR